MKKFFAVPYGMNHFSSISNYIRVIQSLFWVFEKSTCLTQNLSLLIKLRFWKNVVEHCHLSTGLNRMIFNTHFYMYISAKEVGINTFASFCWQVLLYFLACLLTFLI